MQEVKHWQLLIYYNYIQPPDTQAPRYEKILATAGYVQQMGDQAPAFLEKKSILRTIPVIKSLMDYRRDGLYLSESGSPKQHQRWSYPRVNVEQKYLLPTNNLKK